MRELPQHVLDAIARAEAKPALRVVPEPESTPQRVLRFTVPRPPVGKNRRHYYQRKVLTAEARDYLFAVRQYATLEARKVGWPKPNTVGAVCLEITTYNTKHDADAAIALTQDALEGIVYANDRVVQGVDAKKAKDDGAARVEIAVTLVSMAGKLDKRRRPRGGYKGDLRVGVDVLKAEASGRCPGCGSLVRDGEECCAWWLEEGD